MICIRQAHPPIWFHLHGKHADMILPALWSLKALRASTVLKVLLPSGCVQCWSELLGQGAAGFSRLREH